MKKVKASRPIPEPTEGEVAAALPKSETVQIRVTKLEKEEIVASAAMVGLTQTDYLLSCHRVVSRKLGRRG